MSKHSTSRLTASRKTRVRRRAAWPGVDWLDAMNDRCRALETLGLALVTATEHAGAEPLPAELGTGLGELILREVRAVRDLTDSLGKGAR